jgi:hypothetical protein
VLKARKFGRNVVSVNTGIGRRSTPHTTSAILPSCPMWPQGGQGCLAPCENHGPTLAGRNGKLNKHALFCPHAQVCTARGTIVAMVSTITGRNINSTSKIQVRYCPHAQDMCSYIAFLREHKVVTNRGTRIITSA